MEPKYHFFLIKKAFDELKKTQGLFISLRQNYDPQKVFDEFCEAVANNPCCNWLKYYIENPDNLETQEYQNFINNSDMLKGNLFLV